MLYVSCAVLGHDKIFSVHIENSDIEVAVLAHHIKAAQPRMLRSYDNSDLILYKVDLPISDTIMERIHLGTVEYRQEQKLNSLFVVSFGATEALERRINILVVPHTGESSHLSPDRDLPEIVSSPRSRRGPHDNTRRHTPTRISFEQTRDDALQDRNADPE